MIEYLRAIYYVFGIASFIVFIWKAIEIVAWIKK
jgi:hypothetical protein